MKKVELLAPAGNMKCLIVAIEAGCDAVYLGGTMFGARAFAGNFSDKELVEAIKYAHLYGVKVYLTINTIIYEDEVERFVNYVRFVHKNNIDAVLIEDLGMLDLLKKKFPNLEIHASTQMHIHNYEGALFAKKHGVKRVVMARETPLEVIKRINEEIDIETEVFVHGALCVSYSGQCLASALIGHRSGNRGTCAQICRKKYDLVSNEKKVNKDKYLLSTRDLCTLNYIDKIIESGVNSLKIEGRMKRPEYVYLITSIYRKVIDNYYSTGKVIVSDKDITEIKKIFNRDFTKGFMLGEKNESFVNQERPNHKGIFIGRVLSKQNNILKIKLAGEVNINDGLRIIDKKEDKGLVITKMFVKNKSVRTAFKDDVISIKYDDYVENNSKVMLTTCIKQIKEVDERLNHLKRKVGIKAIFTAKIGDKMKLTLFDEKNKVEVFSDKMVEKAVNTPVSEEVILRQICKTGNTVYLFEKISLDVDESIFINIKDINELRRHGIEMLNNKRLYSTNFIEKDYYFNKIKLDNKKQMCMLVNTINEYNFVKDKCDVIYTENEDLLSKGCVLRLPRVINKYKKYNCKLLVSEVGSLIKYKDFETDFSLNVTNSYTVYFLHNIGANKVTLSYELNINQMKKIIDKYKERYKMNPNVEVIIDSYPDAMITKFDLNKKHAVKNAVLKDEYGNNYELKSYENYMIIKHYNKINCLDKEEYYKIGVNSLRKNME